MREKEGKTITDSRASGTLLNLLATMPPSEEDFPAIEDHPPEPVDLDQHFGGPDHGRGTHARAAHTHRSG